MTACSIAGCEKPANARGWCATHYYRWRRHGDPLTVRSNYGVPAEERFWPRVVEGDDGCWIWTAAKIASGYGSFVYNRRRGYAHRFAYEQLVGVIPDGLELDHLCRNRACVNPDHLEPVTPTVNKTQAHEARRAERVA